MPYIEELIDAIKEADKLEFDASFKEHLRKYSGLGNHPSSAYTMDGKRKVLYLNFGIDSQHLTEDIVEKIAPHLKGSGITSIGFYGADPAAPTPAMKKLHAIIEENEKILENVNTGKKMKM